MRKWVVFTILFIVIGSGVLLNVYLNATEPINEARQKAFQIAAENTNLDHFSDFHLYNGEEVYYVFTGKNVKNEDVFIWISEKDHKIFARTVKSGITKSEALNKLYEEKKPKEIIDIRLGMARIQKTDRPAWEIYYRTENQKMNYFYVDFESGQKLRAIDNL